MKKRFIISILVLMTLTCLVAYGVIKYPYSTGMRTGKLVKLSKKGFIFKTYEGILDLGSGDQLTWMFSIRDKELGEELLNKTGRMIQLNYVEHLYKLFFNTKYNVTSWKVMDDLGDQSELLCRLVDVLRNDKELVEKVRPLLEAHDEGLLKMIRNCQK